MILIYALLAIPLKSYFQPLVIMSVIPFGAVGAIVGHYVMGWNLIFFSLLGIIALSGVCERVTPYWWISSTVKEQPALPYLRQ